MKLLPNDDGSLFEEPEYFGERTFLKEATERFPQLVHDPDAHIGIHLSMAALGRLVVQALRMGDTHGAKAIVEFLSDVLAKPRLHPEVRNAVSLSFVEASELAMSEAGRDLLASMPQSVRQLLG